MVHLKNVPEPHIPRSVFYRKIEHWTSAKDVVSYVNRLDRSSEENSYSFLNRSM